MSLHSNINKIKVLLIVILAFYSLGVSSQISATIISDKVTSNYEVRKELNNGGCPDVFINTNSGNQENIFIEFDLSELDSDLSISNAVLSLVQGKGTGENGDIVFNVYRVTKPWVEGSGSYYENTPGLNWNSTGITDWETPGGDFAGTVYASAVGNFSNPEGTVYNLDITTLANEWLYGIYPNYGLVLVPQTNDKPWLGLYSDDAKKLEYRPSLEVIQEAYNSSTSIVDLNKSFPDVRQRN
ncbi:DNRLRE domain-containing protein [Psychroflexus sp. CAK57W]|uniref:DNRLRE domain-containing protein n=1 Tax=Psychroflexus curvus TaxID=2873595 RepID=UPI001CCEAE8F|nr:DNRLRE domain-containing protein [Psychroflexus curvus]MBZ9788459.1 DNRLRE domain-containing protein [Psychroflexus curvus]